MNKIVNGYLDFINEKKIELILEAKIQFLPGFTNLISKINSPITDALQQIVGKDVDVNTNFIDISQKDDLILFIPDDKIKNIKYKYLSAPDTVYYLLTNKLSNTKYSLGDISFPQNDTIGEIVYQFTEQDINKLSSDFNYDIGSQDSIVHFRFNKLIDNTEKEFNILLKKSSLELDVSNFKKTEYKIGKFITKLLTKANYNPSATQIEDFVNKYKTQMQLNKKMLTRFEIVKGEDIRKYYLEDNYVASEKGSLYQSCMKHNYCQPYFDIYVNNPEKVNMIILKQKDNQVEEYVDEDTGEIIQLIVTDKITGRAILWTDNKGRKIMDRIYVNDTADIEFFKEYAKANNFLYKKEQDFNEETLLMDKNNQLSKTDSEIIVELKPNKDYSKYPYMDTLKYYTIKTGILTNRETPDKNFYLEDTYGNRQTCTFCEGRARLDCPECIGSGNQECLDCNGTGQQKCKYCKDELIDCNYCNNTKLIDCQECNGDGENICDFCNGNETVDCPEC